MVAVFPVVAMSTVLLVVAGGGANVSPTSAACGGAGTGQRIGSVSLDAEQMADAQTIVSVVAGRRLPVYAADVAVTTAYTESTLHNAATQTDHDSEGLFQQRISIYTAAVALDPVKATDAFLDRLVRISGWQRAAIGIDAQAVQDSEFPGRYQPNATLGEQLVGQFWSSALAAAATAVASERTSPHATGPADVVTPTATSTSPPNPALETAPAVCAGGGGTGTGGQVAGTIIGPTGNNIAGVTTIPAGFVINGSTKAHLAVTFALAQLGKPYVFGAAGPNAYDCSGLTMAAWASAGVALPHLAAAQTGYGTPEPTDLSQAVAGDLVMIPGSDGTPSVPGHVGMVAGYVDSPKGRHLYIVNAPETGLPVELTEATEWSGQIVDVRHIA
jgi:cell wall-associated NlpC family hydrolase